MSKGDAPDLLVQAARCGDFAPSVLERVFFLLPEDQQNSIAKNRRPEDRNRRLAARALLAAACERYLRAPPHAVLGALSADPQGRLHLNGPLSGLDISFSLSHSGDYVSCALSRASVCGSVGLDVEEVRPLDPEDFRKVFTAREVSAIAASPSPDDELVRLWTIKEAVLKCHGSGFLANPLDVNAERPEFFPLPGLAVTQRRLDNDGGNGVYWLTAATARPWVTLRITVGADHVFSGSGSAFPGFCCAAGR